MFRGFFGESILRRAAAMGAATIRKVFDIEGVEDIGAGTFSADAVEVNAAAAEGGKVKFTVTPKGAGRVV